jgi:microcystin-dependent protein
MSEPFLGQIQLFSFNFPPRGWAECAGQMLPVNQYQALFSLLGTFYGGDGRTNFALPDLRGRSALGEGSGYVIGSRAGEERHTLSTNEMPRHTHAWRGSSVAATVSTPAARLLAASPGNVYAPAPANVTLSPRTISQAGGSQPHENMQPYLVVTFCIALVGIFPSRN